MKFHESKFDEYIARVDEFNFHPSLYQAEQQQHQEIIKSGEQPPSTTPPAENNKNPLIFYGPCGCGKYSQMLYWIAPYSPSRLKHQYRMSVTYNKQIYCYLFSDVHFEIDMALLGCNAKQMWHEIYLQIIDIVSARVSVSACPRQFVVLKNFHEIHSELLEVFYNYMQQQPASISAANTASKCIQYVFLTEHLSFIPNQITSFARVIPVRRPTPECFNLLPKMTSNQRQSQEQKAEQKNMEDLPSPTCITNLKECALLRRLTPSAYPVDAFNVVCDSIISFIVQQSVQSNYSEFREALYDILIYNINVGECIWYILQHVVFLQQQQQQPRHQQKQTSIVIAATFEFFKYYNNNYRPIFHLEKVVCLICKVMSTTTPCLKL